MEGKDVAPNELLQQQQGRPGMIASMARGASSADEESAGAAKRARTAAGVLAAVQRCVDRSDDSVSLFCSRGIATVAS
jgi:hypothetical protein